MAGQQSSSPLESSRNSRRERLLIDDEKVAFFPWEKSDSRVVGPRAEEEA